LCGGGARASCVGHAPPSDTTTIISGFEQTRISRTQVIPENFQIPKEVAVQNPTA